MLKESENWIRNDFEISYWHYLRRYGQIERWIVIDRVYEKIEWLAKLKKEPNWQLFYSRPLRYWKKNEKNYPKIKSENLLLNFKNITSNTYSVSSRFAGLCFIKPPSAGSQIQLASYPAKAGCLTFESPERLSKQLKSPLLRADFCVIYWYSQGDSNPCFRRERPAS